jgi:uncharacterized membrane protein YkvA (DUF1232 family)
LKALALAAVHPRLPWYVRIFPFLTAAYALSPVDLIPDFIPVLGYLDDLILIPLGIWLSIKMIPRDVWEECLRKARNEPLPSVLKKTGLVLIIILWTLLAGLILWAVFRHQKSP